MESGIPVHIVDKPDFWLTYVVPWISVVAAVVAALAAIWAIRAVHLTKRALIIAQREAECNEAERNKKPFLILTLNGSVDTRVQVEDGGMVYFEVHVDNLGDRPAHNVTVEIDLPLNMEDRCEYAQVPDGERLIAFAYNNGTHAILRQKPETVLVHKAAPLYIGTIALRFTSQGDYKALPDLVTFPWRIATKEGAWQSACSALIEPHQEQWFETDAPLISTD